MHFRFCFMFIFGININCIITKIEWELYIRSTNSILKCRLHNFKQWGNAEESISILNPIIRDLWNGHWFGGGGFKRYKLFGLAARHFNLRTYCDFFRGPLMGKLQRSNEQIVCQPPSTFWNILLIGLRYFSKSLLAFLDAISKGSPKLMKSVRFGLLMK